MTLASQKDYDRAVGIGQIVVSRREETLIVEGLGSCLVLLLHDPANHFTAVSHTLLPDGDKQKKEENPGKYVQSAIREMRRLLVEEHGSKASDLVAKMAGGAHMFHFASEVERLTIGDKNIQAAKDEFKAQGIYLAKEDTGGDKGRTLLIHTASGSIDILTIKGSKRSI